MSDRQGKAQTRAEANKSEVFDSVRVVDEPTAIMIAGLSARTWDRLRSKGEAPPITRISQRRIGYRLSDLRDWLDGRRVTPANG
jgi:predicted DNA-binding transcriptional regulator AlpA